MSQHGDFGALAKEAAVFVKVGDLTPWAQNPRKNDSAVSSVAESIRRFGFGAPILASARTGEVIAGHTRLKAALSLGMKEVPVRYMNLTDAQAHALALADNKIGELADWDGAALPAVLEDLVTQEVDLAGLGFTQAELDDLLGRAVGDGGDPFGGLPTDAPKFRSMTFTLTHEQHEAVEAALKAAADAGPFGDTGNENRNGNALARVCEAYRG